MVYKTFEIYANIIQDITQIGVGIARRYRDVFDGRVSIIDGGKIFSSPQRSDRLWDPPNLLHNGYPGLFFRV
jgi:hypothetical protein